MEVAVGVERPAGPFARHNVQEWSRLDQLTGLLEHARVETDHWTASTSNSSHHFGKVVDSRSRNLAGGGQEQRHQTKQLEVFQAHIPGGSVQVIRSSTSSSWQSHKILSGGSGWTKSERLALPSSENQDFDQLKLALNPLDLSSQKSKASVGRSGSIGSRRPPSRPRSIAGVKPEESSEQTDGKLLTDLSKICHKVHEEAKQVQGSSARHSSHDSLSNGYSFEQSENDVLLQEQLKETKHNLNSSGVDNVTKSNSDTNFSSSHFSLIRKKSCSSEDLHVLNEERNDSDSTTSDWRRSSKVRRSLQFPPKPPSNHKETLVIPVTKSVAEIKREIEARKQLVTNSFRASQWNNLAELEGVLGASNGHHEEDLSKDNSEPGTISPSKTKKRETFITAETLKEVRGRLRKLNSPVDEVLKCDDVDDGIETGVKPLSPTEEVVENSSQNSVKSYVFGMEVMLRKTKPPIIGTGSLESRSSNKSLTNGNNRSEEWYNRRKSYGFEQVGNQSNNYSSFEKSKIESSTDSGICRSSDTIPSWPKLIEKSSSNQTSPVKTTHSIIIKPYHGSDLKKGNIEGDAVVQIGRKTVVNLTSNAANSSWVWSSKNGCPPTNPEDDGKEGKSKGKIADTIRSLHEKTTVDNQRLSEPITISIPIQQSAKSTDPTNLLLKQTKPLSGTDKDEMSNGGTRNGITPYSELLFGKDLQEPPIPEDKYVFDNIPWRGSRTKTLSNFFDSEFKRHSIAVDQTKYLTNKKSFGSYYFDGAHNNDLTSQNNTLITLNNNEKDSNRGSVDSDHELSSQEKKHKRVEFCKTEVHFAAEPGRFNIVETDGKPPPSNMYRRRRKTTSDTLPRNGLPEVRFGDTQYEKNMLSMVDPPADDSQVTRPISYRSSPVFNTEKDDSVLLAPTNTLIVQTKDLNQLSNQHDDPSNYSFEEQIHSEDDIPRPRSILKNNLPKPKPYLLGESPEIVLNNDSLSGGGKLTSQKVEEVYPKFKPSPDVEKETETEFQKLLKSLRPAASKPLDLFDSSTQPEHSSRAADNGLEVRISSSALPPDHRRASWSVADRIRHVEEARGYSTKVNFGPQETTVVDPGIKANHGMSHFNPSENLRSNWFFKEQNSFVDPVPRVSPSFGSASHQRVSAESTTELPNVTSISLHYGDTRQPTAAVRPTSLYATAAELKYSPTTFVSRNLLNTDSLGISSKVELSNNGDRTWSFSKVSNDELVFNKVKDSEFSSVTQQQSVKKLNGVTTRDINSSPSRFSRNSQSPSKETLFLERAAERNNLFNETRQMSSSPTSGTSKKISSSVNIKLDSIQSNSRKSDRTNYPSRPFTNVTSKLTSQSNLTNLSKSKAEDKVENVKRQDTKKPASELRGKERKLSTSSSGRDGWLNTPKEVPIRKKTESSARKTEVKRDSKINERSFKVNGVKTIQKRTESPIYQNREIYAERQDSNDNTETESTILEELTKAADQILLAVNGYTDDDSFKASSEDEYRKKRDKSTPQPLCTIAELPTKTTKTSSRQTGVIKSTRSTDLRKEYRSSTKNKTSSNSSMESGHTQDVKPLLSSEDRSKRRAARLLQRASSRELLFQTTASSSEDIGSGSDTGSLRTKRVYRRPRLQNGKQTGSKPDVSATATESRTKERVQQTVVSSESQRTHRSKTQAETRCSRHSKSTTGPATSERRERRPHGGVVTHSSRTQYVPHCSRTRTRHAPRPQCPCF